MNIKTVSVGVQVLTILTFFSVLLILADAQKVSAQATAQTLELTKDEKKFISKLNKFDGKSGNISLRRELYWSKQRYSDVRNRLIEKRLIDLGRGRGGSVILKHKDPTQTKNRVRELDLYEPALEVISKNWTKSEKFDDSVSEITGLKGRQQTGGTWTRPDISVAGIRKFEFYPSLVFDVVTFEIKPVDSVDVKGVYEALSHRDFATQAYVVYAISLVDFNKLAEAERIENIATQFGIGVILAGSIDDFDKWDELVPAKSLPPQPHRIDQFVRGNFGSDNRTTIAKWQK